jgi:hypothetical protein
VGFGHPATPNAPPKEIVGEFTASMPVSLQSCRAATDYSLQSKGHAVLIMIDGATVYENYHNGWSLIFNQFELAHYGQISTTRMSQIMWLDNLAPDIQEQILNLPRTIQGRDAILEREVRPIAKTLDWGNQRKMWADLLHRSQASPPTDSI